jgi:large subunit ribosomal protein L19
MNAREIIDSLEKKKALPDFRVGDTVKVHVKIVEGEKERIQIFEGTVIKRRRGGRGATFTVRKTSYGIGVERVFANQSPSVDRVEVLTRGKVRRARLYYLRSRRGKESAVEGTTWTEETPASETSESSAKPEARKETSAKSAETQTTAAP